MLCVVATAMCAPGAFAQNRKGSKGMTNRPLLPSFTMTVKPATRAEDRPEHGKIQELESLIDSVQKKRAPAQVDPSTLDPYHRLLRLFQKAQPIDEATKREALYKGVCVRVQRPKTLIPNALAETRLAGNRFFLPLLGSTFEGVDPKLEQKLQTLFKTNPRALLDYLEQGQGLFTPISKEYPSRQPLGLLLQREFENSMLFSHQVVAADRSTFQRLFRLRQLIQSGKRTYLIQEICNQTEGCSMGNEGNNDGAGEEGLRNILFGAPLMHCYYDEEIPQR
jgi:hypothetical protein